MTDRHHKAQAFRALHERDGLFVIPNPWDAGSAKLLAHLGFEALATTSAGLAFTLGRCDAQSAVSREEALANARVIVEASDLPVAADLENGYGDSPEDCATTIRLAASIGLVGGSIEDASGREDEPIYPFELAVERVRAAVQAAQRLGEPFTLTARAENHLHGRDDLDDTIRRLQAFAEVGADVLYAPGLNTREAVQRVLSELAPKPVNILLSGPIPGLSLEWLAEVGVKRVSVGSALSRVALGAFYQAAQALRGGDVTALGQAMPFDDLNRLFR